MVGGGGKMKEEKGDLGEKEGRGDREKREHTNNKR